MKTFILAVFVVVSFSSCTYQYLTLASDNTRLNEKNEFIAENDTLRVVYNFYGKNGPVSIDIYNKSGDALEIDWRRSSLIIGENPVSFHKPEVKIDGDITRSGVLRSSDSKLNAVIHRHQGVEFIPPQSTIGRSGMFITRRLVDMRTIDATPVDAKKKLSIKKTASFSKEDSPIKVRSYLTFVIPTKGDFVFPVEHSFYVSELLQTNERPEFVIPQKNRGNKFYLSGMGG